METEALNNDEGNLNRPVIAASSKCDHTNAFDCSNSLDIFASIPTGDTDIEIGNNETTRWPCHIHSCGLGGSSSSSRSINCWMAFMGNLQFHITNVSKIPIYAQKAFNWAERIRAPKNEFWELLSGNIQKSIFVCSLGQCSSRTEMDFVRDAMKLLRQLDELNLVYAAYGTPEDMVFKHLITDGRGRLILCNKHLIKRPNQSVHRQKWKYTNAAWEKRFIKTLFPKITVRRKGVSNGSNQIPTDTRNWVLDILEADCSGKRKAVKSDK